MLNANDTIRLKLLSMFNICIWKACKAFAFGYLKWVRMKWRHELLRKSECQEIVIEINTNWNKKTRKGKMIQVYRHWEISSSEGFDFSKMYGIESDTQFECAWHAQETVTFTQFYRMVVSIRNALCCFFIWSQYYYSLRAL